MPEKLVPPSNLDRESKRLWASTVDALKLQKTWLDSDVPLLERYIRACEVARHARRRISQREKKNVGSGYTATGSQGQLVQHPDVKTAREAERDANDYASDLILTPAARRRHDVKPPEGRSKLGALYGRADAAGRSED